MLLRIKFMTDEAPRIVELPQVPGRYDEIIIDDRSRPIWSVEYQLNAPSGEPVATITVS